MRTINTLVLTLLIASPIVGQQQTLRVDARYPAGTRVLSPWTGVSFVIPDGFVAGYDSEEATFLMLPQSENGVVAAVYAASEAGLEEIGGYVFDRLASQGIQLVQDGEPSTGQDRSSSLYVAMTEQGRGVLYGTARTGPEGNAIVVAALRMGQDASGLSDLVDGIVSSVTFTTVGTTDWRQLAAGSVLTSTSGSDHFSPSGSASGSASSDTESTLDLCSNGQYAYQERTESYISVEGAGTVSRDSSDGHSGEWWLVADLMGNAILGLEATDGREFQWSVVESGDGVLLQGTPHSIARSQHCS